MSDAKEIEKEKKFIEEYFKQINELDVDTLKKYFIYVKQHKKGTDDEKVPIKTFINTISEGKGKKAIHFGASRGNLDVFKFLVKKGADVNLLDDMKNNPFLIAIQHNNINIVKYLIDEHHVDVNYQRETVTGLHLAAQQGNISMIELLLSAGANINALSNYGTPTFFAVANKQNWSALHLIGKGANLNLEQSEYLPSLLHLIIDQNNLELFQTLFREYPDRLNVNIKDPDGWSVLHLCAEKGFLDYAKVLIQHGADVNYENKGQSPLDVAVQQENWDCVQYLRELALRKEAQIPQTMEKLSEEEIQTLYKEINTEKQEANNQLLKQNYQEAIKIYQQLISKALPIIEKYNTEFVKLFTNLAQAQIKLQQYKDALNTCKQARLVHKDWIKIYYYEGQAFEGINEFGEAAASYFEALKIQQDAGIKQMFDQAMKKGKELYKQK